MLNATYNEPLPSSATCRYLDKLSPGENLSWCVAALDSAKVRASFEESSEYEGLISRFIGIAQPIETAREVHEIFAFAIRRAFE